MAFASGKRAWGICDITGFRYKLSDMNKKWDGLMVGPDQWDSKQPQLSPSPPPVDPEAIRNARPDTADDNNFFVVYSNVGLGKLGAQLDTYEVEVELGTVTIVTT